jgi:uncharacterized protein
VKITNLVIWLTEACNLNCSYCYERHQPVAFDIERVQDTVLRLFMDDQMDLKAERNGISFFGGEPLLEYENMTQFIEWLETTIPRPFRYHITTNGTLIDEEKAQYLASKHFGMLFSIDGDREAMLARSDSYDASVAALEHVWAVGLHPEANMTFTPEQMHRATTNIQHVVDLGFTTYNLNQQSGASYDFTETLNALLTVYRYHMEYLHGAGIRTSSLSKAFKAIELREKQGGACGAGKGFVAISPTGDIYPCHKLIQVPATRLAEHGGQISGIKRGWWERFDPKQNETCDTCAVRPLCAGSCGADNALICGDFHRPVPSGCTFISAWLTAAQTVYWECSEQERWEVWHSDNEAVCEQHHD